MTIDLDATPASPQPTIAVDAASLDRLRALRETVRARGNLTPAEAAERLRILLGLREAARGQRGVVKQLAEIANVSAARISQLTARPRVQEAT